MSAAPDMTDADRFDQLVADAVTVGLSKPEAAELARLEEALGPEATERRRSMERAAAEVALASVDATAGMPARLRRQLQEDAFAHFEDATRGRDAAPITTAGANVVALPARPPPPSGSRARPWVWAAAAAMLLTSGVAIQRWRAETAGAVAASGRLDVSDRLEAESAGARLELRWRPESRRGTLTVTPLPGAPGPLAGRVVLIDRAHGDVTFELARVPPHGGGAGAPLGGATFDVDLPPRPPTELELRFEPEADR